MIKLEIPIQEIRCCTYDTGKSICKVQFRMWPPRFLADGGGGKLLMLSGEVGLTLPVITEPMLLLSVVNLIVIHSRIGWARRLA